jgi:hypothetical protein
MLNKGETNMTHFINPNAEANIDAFLDNWEAKTIEYYKNLHAYIVEQEAKWESSKISDISKRMNDAEYWHYRKIADSQDGRVAGWSVSQRPFYVKAFNDLIAKNRKAKKQNLIKSVTKKGGQIHNVVSIYDNGILEGQFKCDKGIVDLRTIDAGGYNIQKYHYRTITTLRK